MRQLEERARWLNETYRLERRRRKRSGETENYQLCTMVVTVEELIRDGIYEGAKALLDQARVPHVPYVDLPRERVTVR